MSNVLIGYEYEPQDDDIDDDDATIYEYNGVIVMVRGLDGFNHYEVRALSDNGEVVVVRKSYPTAGQFRTDLRPDTAREFLDYFNTHSLATGHLVRLAFKDLGWL